MTPLLPFQVCSPAEDLQPSQGVCNAYNVRKARKSITVKFGSWNVRSMVDTEGPVEVASQHSQRGEDRKVDQVLGRYDIVVGALQETRWFGSEVYDVGDSVILTAGRSTPAQGQAVQRGEGVALVLRGLGLSAWRRGGKLCKAWSPRCVSASLQMDESAQSRLHVVSCYAPTRAASREDKEAFFQELENIISSVPSQEKYVLLGDFNARVGSRESDEQWAGVRGPHGFGAANDAGKELLSLLASHQATVCNTWFEKRDIHKQSWQHPRSRQWSSIDFVVMRQRDRRVCVDVAAKRGAVCNTDHHLVCAKFRLGGVRFVRRSASREKGRSFDVCKLAVNKDGVSEVRAQYLEKVLERARDACSEDDGVDELWSAIQSALVTTAEDVLGRAGRSQPDWFRDSLEELKPLLELRNAAYSRWLGSGRQEDLVSFRQARGCARRAVRKAKNTWFQEKAEEIERERFGGKKVWKAIRDMQRGRRGLMPSRTVAVHDEDGVPCANMDAQHQRWRRHFTKVLNIRSQYDEEEMNLVRQREVCESLAAVPSGREIGKALGQLKNGKAAGKSNILPEMLKAGRRDEDFLTMLKDLVSTVWEERRVPQDWVDAILVPIPKKGNLHSCDNWRGIALLDVVGKLVGRIVQSRLQVLAEKELPESQYGFRRRRSCTDMIFAVRQFAEKAIEHHTKQFLVFVDLWKAYDSVPREAMWCALRRLGVPDVLVDIVQSFHSNMVARIRVDGELLEEIGVSNGLRQGCTMAPTLFNLYACVVAERWLERVKGNDGAGTRLLYKLDEQLFRIVGLLGEQVRCWSPRVSLLMMWCCWLPLGRLQKLPSGHM